MASVVSNLKAVSKVLVAALGFIVGYLNQNLDIVPEQYRGLVTGIIAVLTLAGVYQAPHGQVSLKRRSAGRSGTRKPAVSKPGAHPHTAPDVVEPND